MEISKILYPTDFSPASENAFHFANGLANKLNASLELLHLYEPLEIDAKTPGDYHDQLLKEREEKSLKQMEVYSARIENQNNVTIKAIEDYSSERIASYARNQLVDLIVMGTHGASGIKQNLVGSNTANVIEHADCMVMAIPEKAVFKPFRHIIFAVDYKAYDYGELHKLHTLLELLEAPVTILHVLTDDMEVPDENFQARVINEFYDPGKVIFKYIYNDNIFEGIEEYIKKSHADLVVMKFRKNDFWSKVLNKSYTRKLAFHSEIPLLTIP